MSVGKKGLEYEQDLGKIYTYILQETHILILILKLCETQSQRDTTSPVKSLRGENVSRPLLACFFHYRCSGQSAQMDQGHDSGVFVLQTVRVSVAKRVVVFDDAVAANLAVAEQAEEWRVGEHLVKGVGLYVGLVLVVVLASPHAGEHEPQGVPLGNFGCFQPPDGGFGRFWVADFLVQEHRCPLHLGAAQGQTHHAERPLATATGRQMVRS